MNIMEEAQGSPAWHTHRASHFNASDAPAMLGLSPYKTRSELLRELATGHTPEIDPATQRRFDDGHRFEALARPVAERILGEELFPVVGYEGKLSASFDGLTMDGSVCFEHKTLNAAYRKAIEDGSPLPDALLVQIEQQLWVAQAERCLFMASKWSPDGELIEEVHCMVASDPDLLATVLKGWDQFQHDLENYQHEEVKVAPVAAPIEALPALAVTVSGSISLTHNLERFGQRLSAFVGGLKIKPETDQDFADLDAAVKVLKEAEAALDAAESNALAQTTTIADMCNLVAMYRKTARDNRLMFEKIVKQEKENRKTAILNDAAVAIAAHVNKLNARIGGNWMPVNLVSAARFAESIKGMKSLDAMRDKVSTALAQAKIEANEIADRIEENRKVMEQLCDQILFPDFAQACTKQTDDFAALVAMRVSQDEQRKEAERVAAEAKTAAAVAAAIEAERMAEAKRVAEASRISTAAAIFKAGTENPLGGLVEAAQPTPETKRAAVVEAQDVISTFLNSRTFGTTPVNVIRAILVEFVKHQAGLEPVRVAA